MAIDAQTGLLTWTPPAGAAAATAVVVEVFDTRGAVALQRFVLTVAGGNRAPNFTLAPSRSKARRAACSSSSSSRSTPTSTR